MKSLKLDLGERSYPIHIGPGLLARSDLLQGVIRGRRALIVSNETVAPLYLQRLESSICANGITSDRLILPDGERYKSLEVTNTLFDALLERRHDRGTTLVALGGGVVGDITGFAAACYQRGVDFVQIPTTLLAQVDSSVGGKTGVNHPLGKNMIGAFHQPRAVIADTDTLNTLADDQLAAGMAEVIKYGLIRDLPFLEWLEASVDGLNRRDPALLTEAIERSCRNKAEVVAADERESGQRALLNLGHTFGHAIEAETGYGAWLHGAAVAVGMSLAARLSVAMGWIDQADAGRIDQLLLRARLPTLPPATMTVASFLEWMAVDKKVADGQLRLVLMRAVGEAVVTGEFDPQLLHRVLEEALADSAAGNG